MEGPAGGGTEAPAFPPRDELRTAAGLCWAAAVLLSLAGSAARAADVRVRDAAGLAAALKQAAPGTRVLLAPGDYAGGLLFSGMAGAPGRPIVIGAEDPRNPPRFRGG